jgi:hypothetical protein
MMSPAATRRVAMACAVVLGSIAPIARGEPVPAAAPNSTSKPTTPSSKHVAGRTGGSDAGDAMSPKNIGGIFHRR